uniref:BZIP domain-containing protein n=1 Tax=Panagrolaimus sp. ES5 TaxID=591445 RepID=A0AC34FHL9_9BILA
MTSSLTQQTQLTFNPARFLPIDLSQPVYGGLYPTVSTQQATNFNHFVQSTFFCKDLQDVYASAATEHHQKTLTTDLSKTIKHDYGPLSDSDSCSNSSSGSHRRHPSASLSPNGTTHNKGSANNNGEKKRKELVRDDAYYERRKKNNDAAKRSRDSRKRKEDEVAMRAALLEQENLRLRFEVERLKTEIDRHRIVALNSKIVADAVGNNSVAAAAAAAAQLSFGAPTSSTSSSTVISNHSS